MTAPRQGGVAGPSFPLLAVSDEAADPALAGSLGGSGDASEKDMASRSPDD